ncbi:hypothetical protein F2P45_07815 [Massilia sp. CCM 8733]|uniref:Uncharacterized protein n=1 Tax=Massilia mucilaginosa TaxID=2609282 RepID=A0ABX0NQA7_9BURK|nr:hypothetical protein [Massilia mucilaginosa]NHZ88925.1 hypothetical protein [Massilia mucilaginosa]
MVFRAIPVVFRDNYTLVCLLCNTNLPVLVRRRPAPAPICFPGAKRVLDFIRREVHFTMQNAMVRLHLRALPFREIPFRIMKNELQAIDF